MKEKRKFFFFVEWKKGNWVDLWCRPLHQMNLFNSFVLRGVWLWVVGSSSTQSHFLFLSLIHQLNKEEKIIKKEKNWLIVGGMSGSLCSIGLETHNQPLRN